MNNLIPTPKEITILLDDPNISAGLKTNILEVINLEESFSLDCLDFYQKGFDLKNKPENLENVIIFIQELIKK